MWTSRICLRHLEKNKQIIPKFSLFFSSGKITNHLKQIQEIRHQSNLTTWHLVLIGLRSVHELWKLDHRCAAHQGKQLSRMEWGDFFQRFGHQKRTKHGGFARWLLHVQLFPQNTTGIHPTKTHNWDHLGSWDSILLQKELDVIWLGDIPRSASTLVLCTIFFKNRMNKAVLPFSWVFSIWCFIMLNWIFLQTAVWMSR